MLRAQAVLLALWACGFSRAQTNGDEELQPCGDAFYYPSKYTCYGTDFLCPIIGDQPTLKCGRDCYLPEMYSCTNDKLVYPPNSDGGSAPPSTSTSSSPGAACTKDPTAFELDSPPYKNYFYSDCHAATQVVVTSPEPDSNLSIISPRIIVAWPAGNSGILSYFEPQSGVNGTLGIQFQNSSIGSPLGSVYDANDGGNATVGVSTQLEFNSSAVLTVAILGSIRSIRDFTEGPSLLQESIQKAVEYKEIDNGVEISRIWLDNITTSTMSFTSTEHAVRIDKSTPNTTITFEAGSYTFNASFDYPQLTQLTSEDVLSSASAGLITEEPSQTTSLSFLSYTEKITTGAWRFLTYFGRDSMIAALLLEPVLSTGEKGALEAVIAGVLERVNRTDGTACHEETIGDYSTFLNLQKNITSTAPQCDYKMVDTDFFLPVLMERYFVRNANGSSRADSFLATRGSIFPENSNLTYKELAHINAKKIVTIAAPFAAANNQTKDNLIHLKEGEIVGEWRDSTYGIGGGRIPYDVNAALVPAGLRAIASLSAAGILDFNSTLIDEYAQVWEDSTLELFEVSVSLAEAKSQLESYASSSGTKDLKSQSDLLDGDITFHALALDGNNNLSKIEVMNTDDCFRHFLLNTTNESQLTSYLNSSANNIHRRFPAGLMTDVGLIVANPAYGKDPIYAENFTTSAYHGTVVWSWQLAMMARGLELQLDRCESSSKPQFCSDDSVHNNVKAAYNTLWDSIEENEQHLTTEVWSWTYDSSDDGKFKYIDLGALPPPPGSSPTESNIVQLWSLTFLAVKRDERFK